MSNTAELGRGIVVAGHAFAFANTGVVRYTERLIRLLSRHAPEIPIHVIVPRTTRAQAAARALETGGCTIHWVRHWLPRRRPLLSQIATILPLALQARRLCPGMLFLAPWDLLGPLSPRRRIAVTHDALPFTSPRGGRIRRQLWYRCQQWAARATEWVTISDFAAGEIAEACPSIRRRPTVIPNWLEPEFHQPARPDQLAAIRQRYNLPDRFWLYVGGYARHKNVELLIRAHTAASRTAAIPPLVLAGHIPTSGSPDSCNVSAELRRQNSSPTAIRQIGFVPDDELPGLYSCAELFLSASLHEGFGYPPVEAMARACPILVADRTSYREIVPRAACRFDPDNEEVLADRLMAAASDPGSLHCPFPAEFKEEAAAARWLALIGRSIATSHTGAH